MTSRWQGAPNFRRFGREVVSKPAISLKKSRGSYRRTTRYIMILGFLCMLTVVTGTSATHCPMENGTITTKIYGVSSSQNNLISESAIVVNHRRYSRRIFVQTILNNTYLVQRFKTMTLFPASLKQVYFVLDSSSCEGVTQYGGLWLCIGN